MKKYHVRQAAFALTQLCFISPNASASPVEQITLHYYERPPFHYTDEKGQPEGLILKKTIEIFHKAGISYSWERTPANRILALIKNDSGHDCSPGWYKNEGRERYAIFSDSIYHDRPLIGLTRVDFKVRDGITAKELFSMPDVRLLLKQNFSQGAYMDSLISENFGERIQRVTVEVPTMVKMLKANRADLIITTEEESETFVSKAGYGMQEFRILKFPDVPAVERRYILCSKNVSPEIIKRMNDAIRKLNP